jgi:hypothetical protein
MSRRIAIVAAALLGISVSHAARAQGNTIYMAQIVPYSNIGQIDRAILAECQLPWQQAEHIVTLAKSEGITVVRDDEAVKAGKGRILQVELVSAVSSGNAFMGHRKQVTIKGRLLEDGTEIGSFMGHRNSMGGAFAGFKGSCSVLDRCVKALGGDIAQWLKLPAKNSRIGD